jgi:hypothetical protein
MAYLCNNMVNLVIADILIPQSLVKVKDKAFLYLFGGCKSLTTAGLNVNFTIPDTITECGNSFLQSMFNGCTSLQALHDTFHLPQKIFVNNQLNFMRYTFANTGLITLPDGFKLPTFDRTYSSEFDISFFSYTFSGCTSLIKLPRNL